MPYRPFDNAEWRNFIQSSVEIPTLVRLLRLPSGLAILEIGCGRGVGLTTLAALCRPRALVGLDVDARLLEVAAERLATHRVDAQLVHGDVTAMPFPDGFFDLVVDFGTCYHVPNQAAALAEVARVLRPGGTFVHETLISQLFAHPVRSRGNRLPWAAAPSLSHEQYAILWARRTKRTSTTQAS